MPVTGPNIIFPLSDIYVSGRIQLFSKSISLSLYLLTLVRLAVGSCTECSISVPHSILPLSAVLTFRTILHPTQSNRNIQASSGRLVGCNATLARVFAYFSIAILHSPFRHIHHFGWLGCCFHFHHLTVRCRVRFLLSRGRHGRTTKRKVASTVRGLKLMNDSFSLNNLCDWDRTIGIVLPIHKTLLGPFSNGCRSSVPIVVYQWV